MYFSLSEDWLSLNLFSADFNNSSIESWFNFVRSLAVEVKINSLLFENSTVPSST